MGILRGTRGVETIAEMISNIMVFFGGLWGVLRVKEQRRVKLTGEWKLKRSAGYVGLNPKPS